MRRVGYLNSRMLDSDCRGNFRPREINVKALALLLVLSSAAVPAAETPPPTADVASGAVPLGAQAALSEHVAPADRSAENCGGES